MASSCQNSGCDFPKLYYSITRGERTWACHVHKSAYWEKYPNICSYKSCINRINLRGQCRYHNSHVKTFPNCLYCERKGKYKFNYQKVCIYHYKEIFGNLRNLGITVNFEEKRKPCVIKRCASYLAFFVYEGENYCREHILKDFNKAYLPKVSAGKLKKRKLSKSKTITDLISDDLAESLSESDEPELPHKTPISAKDEIIDIEGYEGDNNSGDTPEESIDLFKLCEIELFKPDRPLCEYDLCFNRTKNGRFCHNHSWEDKAILNMTKVWLDVSTGI